MRDEKSFVLLYSGLGWIRSGRVHEVLHVRGRCWAYHLCK